MRHNAFMNSLKIVSRYLVLLLCLYVSGLQAADPWYEIEIIVFEPVEQPTTSEKLPLVFEQPSLEAAAELLPTTASPNGSVVPFQVIPDRQLQMSGEAKRLGAGNKYRVLLHTGWRQPLVENGPGTPVHISNQADAGATILNQPGTAITTQQNSIDGTITVLLTRYLHIRPNLVYTNPEVDLARQIINQEKNSPSVEHFVMKESRRVKLEELHYFDHPYFGLIARIARYEPPPAVVTPTKPVTRPALQ